MSQTKNHKFPLKFKIKIFGPHFQIFHQPFQNVQIFCDVTFSEHFHLIFTYYHLLSPIVTYYHLFSPILSFNQTFSTTPITYHTYMALKSKLVQIILN